MGRHAAAAHEPDRAPDAPLLEPSAQQACDALRRRAFYRRWMIVVGAVDVGVGISYLTGPTASATLQLIGQALPIPACASAFCLVGAVLLAGLRQGPSWYTAGGFAGAVLWLVWGGATTITLLEQSALSASGLPLFAGLAMLHLLIVYGAWARLIGGPSR